MKPLKVKTFTYLTLNISSPTEIQINSWLTDNPGIEIVNVTQSESMVVIKGEVERSLSTTVFYRPPGGSE